MTKQFEYFSNNQIPYIDILKEVNKALYVYRDYKIYKINSNK